MRRNTARADQPLGPLQKHSGIVTTRAGLVYIAPRASWATTHHTPSWFKRA